MALTASVAAATWRDCATLALARCPAAACVWRAAESSCIAVSLIVATSSRSASIA